MSVAYQGHFGPPATAAATGAFLGATNGTKARQEVKIGFGIVGTFVVTAFVVILLSGGPTSRPPPTFPDWTNDKPGDPPVDAAPNGNRIGDRPDVRFTKAEFAAHVQGMHKAQIRDEFGSPDAVYDSDDSWLYYKAGIYDADAGTSAMARIQFTGLPAPYDTVVSVHFI